MAVPGMRSSSQAGRVPVPVAEGQSQAVLQLPGWPGYEGWTSSSDENRKLTNSTHLTTSGRY